MKILVVDDVGYARRSLQIILKRAGHEVIEAESGQDALIALERDTAIKAVITDLLMPGMDGVDLFKQANQLKRFNDQGLADPPTFLLLTTAKKDRLSTDRKMAIRLELASNMGFAEVLSKPLDQEKLLGALERIETNEVSYVSNVLQSIRQIQDIINAVIKTKDREAAVCLLECLGGQDRMLREFVAKEGDDG